MRRRRSVGENISDLLKLKDTLEIVPKERVIVRNLDSGYRVDFRTIMDLEKYNNSVRSFINFFSKGITQRQEIGDFMEKYNPSYNLEEFKNSNFETTKTAQRTALKLEFDEEDIHRIVSTLQRRDHYR